MLAELRLLDRDESRRYRRVVLTLPPATSDALDDLARLERRGRRVVAVELLVDAIEREAGLRRDAAAPADPSLPRSVEARRRAAVTLAGKAARRRGER
jgi:hypothetical protein